MTQIPRRLDERKMESTKYMGTFYAAERQIVDELVTMIGKHLQAGR